MSAGSLAGAVYRDSTCMPLLDGYIIFRILETVHIRKQEVLGPRHTGQAGQCREEEACRAHVGLDKRDKKNEGVAVDSGQFRVE